MSSSADVLVADDCLKRDRCLNPFKPLCTTLTTSCFLRRVTTPPPAQAATALPLVHTMPVAVDARRFATTGFGLLLMVLRGCGSGIPLFLVLVLVLDLVVVFISDATIDAWAASEVEVEVGIKAEESGAFGMDTPCAKDIEILSFCSLLCFLLFITLRS